MFGWVRGIRFDSFTIFGFKFVFRPPAVPPGGDGVVNTTGPRKPPVRPDGSPATLTVHGLVVGVIGKEMGIRVKNEDETREFWRVNRLTTKLDWAGKGPPVASIGRKQDREICKPGDEASMTLEVVQRANGERGTRTIAFELIRKG